MPVMRFFFAVVLALFGFESWALIPNPAGVGLFGSYESEVGRPDAVIQRATVLQEAVRQTFLSPPAPIAMTPQNAWQAWQQFLPQLSRLPLWQQLSNVQEFLNAVPFRDDGGHFFSVRDDWQSPRDFILNGGDCEDYAIAKYAALRRLGVPMERLRVVVLHNQHRQSHHAVLAVVLDDDIMILDNLTPGVVSHRHLLHYRPLYSLNENALWFHWYSGEMPPNVVMLDSIRPSGSPP